MNPENGIMGDAMSIDLPKMEIDERNLNEEKNMARYSKSKEFKKIRDHCNSRIDFYQTYLPNGAEIGLDIIPSTEDWRVANRVIGELKLLMNMYDVATDAVEEEVKNA